MRSPKLPAANDSRRAYVPHGIRTPVLLIYAGVTRTQMQTNRSISVYTLLSVYSLHVEYAERGKEYVILFMFSLFCEYMNLEYIHVHAIYRTDLADYVIHILVFAPQEYENIYSTRRV